MSHLVLWAALASSSLGQCGGAAPCGARAGWRPTLFAAPRMAQAAPFAPTAAPMMASAPAAAPAPATAAAPAPATAPTMATPAAPRMFAGRQAVVTAGAPRMFRPVGGLFRGRAARRAMVPMGMGYAR